MISIKKRPTPLSLPVKGNTPYLPLSSQSHPSKLVPKLIEDDPYLAPFQSFLERRIQKWKDSEIRFLQNHPSLKDCASGHLYFGLHHEKDRWVIREWAPNATKIVMMGSFSHWFEDLRYALKSTFKPGVWELSLPLEALKHLDYYQLKIYWPGGEGTRIPSYANYVVQDPSTLLFCAQVWCPPEPYQFKHAPPPAPRTPLIYEAHVGMAQLEGKVSSYQEFIQYTLPRIAAAGYNTIQLMAIQEHPYYGSFGYQVSNFFAPSSRCGTPDELKALIDEAHRRGIRVIMDLVHSHAVKNEAEGLGRFDGTRYQYFHDGGKGEHPAWGTLCFDYAKQEVLHFLLSNCRYWMEEFCFDGFRFDGVTSMIYQHHGLGKNFVSYGDYFNWELEEDAINYLCLANRLIHQINPQALTVAEEMSGLPGMAAPLEHGGIGFDYRLAMGIPDFWIKTLKETADEHWNMQHLWGELTGRRKDEKVISYVESHDQAIVGDQTTIFRLIGAEMYWWMKKEHQNAKIERGIALHKLMRLITLCTARGGYLNFMGNEFGHPEWIDFPREGNSWSYHYARRQWNLRDDPALRYHWLADFDQAMIHWAQQTNFLSLEDPEIRVIHCDDHVIGFERGRYLVIINFDPHRSYTDYAICCDAGMRKLILDSDRPEFGGYGRLPETLEIAPYPDSHSPFQFKIPLYLPARSAQIYEKILYAKS